MSELSILIKKKRLRYGWTQEYLGKKVNVRQATISRIENNKSDYQVNTLIKLMNILKIKIKFYDNEFGEY